MLNLGADIKPEGISLKEAFSQMNKCFTLTINGSDAYKKIRDTLIDAKESGSTLRFLIPVFLASNEEFTFIGEGKLPKRPLKPYFDIFDEFKISYSKDQDNLPLKLRGPLKSGTYYLDGDISSQFITGLLMALPLLEGDSKIILTKKLESKSYVDLTLDVLNSFGIKIKNKNYDEFFITGSQKYVATNYEVEGDYSQGAFFIVAAAMGNDIKITGLNADSKQSDKVILGIIKDIGESIITIDISECPDLLPVLAVLGCFHDGETRIINGKRVRLKECDRIHAMVIELGKLGANIEETSDGVIIKGPSQLKGGICSSHNDHRIAMALSVASSICSEKLILTDSKCINKSYPNFFDDFRVLGGKVYERNLGK